MKKEKNIKYVILVIAIVAIGLGVCYFAGKLSKNNLDFSNKSSYELDGMKLVIKDGKIYYTEELYGYDNKLVETEADNIVSVKVTNTCAGVSEIVYLTSDNKLYSRNIHQVGVEEGIDILLASDALGFALIDINDPEDTCGGQNIVYKDNNGKVYIVEGYLDGTVNKKDYNSK